jgi:hypothetical protein
MKATPSMHPYVAADAQSDQCFILVVFAPMMNDRTYPAIRNWLTVAISPRLAIQPGKTVVEGPRFLLSRTPPA